MTIRHKRDQRQVIIDISGPEGSAFVIMGHAKKFAREIGLDGDAIVVEMGSGDYENLLEVFDSHFGKFVILER